MKVHHEKGHQDKKSRNADFSLNAKLNIAADKLIGQNSTVPLTININNTSIAVYVKEKYIPNNCVSAIRNYCGEKEARNFMMIKYDRSPKVL